MIGSLFHKTDITLKISIAIMLCFLLPATALAKNQAIIENEREKKVFVKVKFIILDNLNIIVELYY